MKAKKEMILDYKEKINELCEKISALKRYVDSLPSPDDLLRGEDTNNYYFIYFDLSQLCSLLDEAAKYVSDN